MWSCACRRLGVELCLQEARCELCLQEAMCGFVSGGG